VTNIVFELELFLHLSEIILIPTLSLILFVYWSLSDMVEFKRLFVVASKVSPNVVDFLSPNRVPSSLHLLLVRGLSRGEHPNLLRLIDQPRLMHQAAVVVRAN